MVEIELQLLGFRAHLSWSHGQMRQVARHLEEAHAIIERRGGSASFLLVTPRRYLAEHVAFTLAQRGFELIDESASGGAADTERTPPFERRDLVRLLDLGLAMLGDLASEIDEVQRLRDGALRLRALLCIQEKEVDLAAHSLRQHSAHKTDAYELLHTHLLFSCHQPAEAQAYALEWLRSKPHASSSTATTLIDLLVMHDAISAALTSITLLSERLGQGEWHVGSEEAEQYSELQQIKHRLLTERAPDSAAAAEHLETILDGHCSGRLPLEEATLGALAAKLWTAGVDSYNTGDMHRTTESFENAYRFLEHTRDKRRQHRVQATIAHCYLLQERIDQAVDRASVSLRLLAECHPEPRATASSVGGGGGEDDLQCLALMVLVKARLKQGDAAAAQAQVEALLRVEPADHLFLASVCEDLAAQGTKHLGACVSILEHVVKIIAATPASTTASAAGVATATTAAKPPPAAASLGLMPTALGGGSHGGGDPVRSERLAAAVRSLVDMRLKAATSAEAAAVAAGSAGGGSGSGQSDGEHKLLLHRAVLADLQQMASRAHCDGAAVCDDPSHLEWLSDTAWNLSVSQMALRETAAQSSPRAALAAVDVSSGAHKGEQASDEAGGKDEAGARAKWMKASLTLCADLTEASSELTAALPATEGRLHAMIRCQVRHAPLQRPPNKPFDGSSSALPSAGGRVPLPAAAERSLPFGASRARAPLARLERHRCCLSPSSALGSSRCRRPLRRRPHSHDRVPRPDGRGGAIQRPHVHPPGDRAGALRRPRPHAAAPEL